MIIQMSQIDKSQRHQKYSQFFHYKNLIRGQKYQSRHRNINQHIETIIKMGTCSLVQPVVTQQVTYEVQIAQQTHMASIRKIGQQKHKFLSTFDTLQTAKLQPKQQDLKTLKFTHRGIAHQKSLEQDILDEVDNYSETKEIRQEQQSSQEIPLLLEQKQNPLMEVSANRAAARRMSALAITGDFLKIKQKQATSQYKVLAKIANKMGQLYKVLDKTTNQMRSLEIIKEEQASALAMNEINLLKKLDHPHIYHLYDVFLKKGFYYVIGEYIQGDNINCLTKNNQLVPQKKLTKLARQIFQALNYLHFRGIMHRNIKPQTIVFQSKIIKTNSSEDFPAIKLINFKKATQKNILVKQQVGSIYYMAPQMLMGSHNQKCDIWSVGVILYFLASGQLPFQGHTNEEIHKNITGKQLTFKEKVWEGKSDSLKILLRQLLNKSPAKRISAHEALSSPWFSEDSNSNNQILVSQGTMQNLLRLGKDSKFKTIIKTYLVKMTASMQERQQMAKKFQSIDKDQSGFIDKEQLISAYKQVCGCEDISRSVIIQNIIKKIDINKSGLIDFSQFMAAVSKVQILFARQKLEKAFEFIDNDGTGEIEIKELIELLNSEIENSQLKEEDDEIVQIMKDFDHDGDKTISKEEFIEFFLRLKDTAIMETKRIPPLKKRVTQNGDN